MKQTTIKVVRSGNNLWAPCDGCIFNTSEYCGDQRSTMLQLGFHDCEFEGEDYIYVKEEE